MYGREITQTQYTNLSTDNICLASICDYISLSPFCHHFKYFICHQPIYVRTYGFNNQRKGRENKEEEIIITSIFSGCPRSLLNALLFKHIFSNDQEANQKDRKKIG